MKYGHMPGAHDEGIRDNPPVRSKFDKSQGKGLPAPHLQHPGETAKPTGSRYPGHTENGHMLPTHRSVGLGGAHLRHHYTPGEMGAPMLKGEGQGHPKNVRLTDGNVVHHSREVAFKPMTHHLHEPDAVHAGSDKHAKQHPTGTARENPKSSRPQHQDNKSSRKPGGHAQLDRVHMKGRS